MKQQKLGRKLQLKKETIATLEQKKVLGGATTRVTDCIPCPCNRTVPTEVICTLYDCPTTIHVCFETCLCG